MNNLRGKDFIDMEKNESIKNESKELLLKNLKEQLKRTTNEAERTNLQMKIDKLKKV